MTREKEYSFTMKEEDLKDLCLLSTAMDDGFTDLEQFGIKVMFEVDYVGIIGRILDQLPGDFYQ